MDLVSEHGQRQHSVEHDLRVMLGIVVAYAVVFSALKATAGIRPRLIASPSKFFTATR